MPAGYAGGFDLDTKKNRVKELEFALNDADFWREREKADATLKEMGELTDLVARFEEIESKIQKLETNFDDQIFFDTRNIFRALEREQLFRGRYDKESAVIAVYPGAGGDDAEDWARILGDMYVGFAKRREWKVGIIDDNIRSRTFEVKGKYAYGYLRREAGVHRLVRISPFSQKKLRHTSFALVEVLPDLPAIEATKIQIPEKDLKTEFSRAGGPGGQNVNKVETAVRIVHIPTGLAVASRAERSQAQNRERALSLLKSKLVQLMEKNHAQELGDLRLDVKPEWGNQIRSYVLNPYQMVKDHRTDIETSNVNAVLEGDLDQFVESELEMLQ